MPGGGLCPICRARLLPPRGLQRTPPWFLALLGVLIAGLFVYVLVLLYQVFVLHKF